LVEQFRLKVLGLANKEKLKEILSGEGADADVKHEQEGQYLEIRIPFIYTSNWKLQEDSEEFDRQIESRFLSINTSDGTQYSTAEEKIDFYKGFFKKDVFFSITFFIICFLS
jgi:hypothetical protein